MRYADTETRQMCEGRDLGGTREAAERQREGGERERRHFVCRCDVPRGWLLVR